MFLKANIYGCMAEAEIHIHTKYWKGENFDLATVHISLTIWLLTCKLQSPRIMFTYNGFKFPSLISVCLYVLGLLVDIMLSVKWLQALNIFIHADILVLVKEFVVVVINFI